MRAGPLETGLICKVRFTILAAQSKIPPRAWRHRPGFPADGEIENRRLA